MVRIHHGAPRIAVRLPALPEARGRASNAVFGALYHHCTKRLRAPPSVHRACSPRGCGLSGSGLLSGAPARCSALLAVLLAAIASSAGEPSAEDKAAAKDAYIAGMELRNAGKPAEALAKFRKAYALLPTPITGLAVGRALEDLGNLVEARTVYRAVVKLPPKPNESSEAVTAREQAVKRAKDVAARIAKVRLKLEGLPDTATPVVFVDNLRLADGEADDFIELDPGKHTIAVTFAGRTKSTSVAVSAGETMTTTISFADGESGAFEAQPADKSATSKMTTATNPLTYWGIGFAVGGFVGGFASYFGWVAPERGKLETCRKNASDCREIEDTWSLNKNVFYGHVVVGTAGAALAVVGFMMPIAVKPTPTSTATLSLGPGWVGVKGTF